VKLNISRHEDADKALLRIELSGGLNTDTAPELDRILADSIAADWQMVLLDMRHLEYISSAGLRVVFKAAKALKGDGRSLAVTNRQPQIEKVFEILQALPDMAVFSNEKELDAYLDAMQARVRGD
jgi:anti-anti-sigma factor